MSLYFYPISPPLYCLLSILLSCPALLLHSALLPYSPGRPQQGQHDGANTTDTPAWGLYTTHYSLGMHTTGLPLYRGSTLQSWDAYYKASPLYRGSSLNSACGPCS